MLGLPVGSASHPRADVLVCVWSKNRHRSATLPAPLFFLMQRPFQSHWVALQLSLSRPGSKQQHVLSSVDVSVLEMEVVGVLGCVTLAVCG